MEIITEKLNNSPNLGEGSREPTEVFQRDFIRGVVSEAMQEWCDGVEKRMWGLQYSLLRQMQHHQVISVKTFINKLDTISEIYRCLSLINVRKQCIPTF